MSVLAWRLHLRHAVRTIVILAAVGSAAILLGCGGGGGGPTPPPVLGACNLPVNSTTSAICGTVEDTSSNAVLQGATVKLTDASGNTVGVATVMTGADGTFVFSNLPANAAGVTVEGPVGYVPNYVLYKSETWDVSKGPIALARPAVPTDDGVFGLYSTNAPPPPPATRP